jgi:uncharacterized protein
MNSYDPDKRKLLSILCHAAIFLSSSVISVGIPIAIMIISDDPVVKENAKESLNFHFNIWLYLTIFGILAWLLIGIPLLFIAIAASWVMPILAIIRVLEDPSTSFRYPFIFRLV